MPGQFLTLSLVAGGCVALAAVLVGCRSTRGRDADAAPATLVPVESVASGDQSAVRRPRVEVARTVREFQALWAEHARLQLPAPAPPEVDLEGAMVVAVFLGDRPSAGHGVQVEGVEAVQPLGGAAPYFLVRAVEQRPDPGAMTAQVITAPFQMVRAPLVEGAPVLDLRGDADPDR